MEKVSRKKTLKIVNLIYFSRVVITMHIPRFDLVISILAHGIDFKMSRIMSYS